MRCPACGSQTSGLAFCGHCGSRIAVEPPREERKVVSAVFADIVGFTERSHEADPEDVQAALRPYYASLKDVIERFGGVVEKFVGDAVVGVFGAPVVHEDDPERATRAALRIQEAVRELNRSRPTPDRLVVRVAVCTGEALVSLRARPERGEWFVTGDVMNTASRLQQEAPPGGVVVDERTYASTRAVIEYEPVPPVRAKGKPTPIPVWLARAARSVSLREARRPALHFVGRDRELALLTHAFETAVETGRAHLITITGEPGLGKTRIAGELRRIVEGPPKRGQWLQGHCLSYAEGTAFGPLGEAVKSFAGIRDSDAPAPAGEILRQAVEPLVEDPAERQWLLAWLAPLVGAATTEWAPGAEEREAFRAWARFVGTLSSRGPLVLALEDLHWADGALVAFLSYLGEACAERPLLVVCTVRPEFFDEHPSWGGGRRNSTTLSLTPLSAEHTESLIAAHLGALLPEVARVAVLERARGNPLYALEFARLVAEQGALHEQSSGVQPTIALPETVQALVAARLDALPDHLKEVVLDAVVVGETFWAGAVASVGERDEEKVLDALRGLAAHDLARPVERSSLEGQHEYSFLHTVVRDVAYAQIPRPDRVRKHRRAAEWIQSLAGDHLPDLGDLVAHHLLAALELARAARMDEEVESLLPPARRALADAAERAMRVDARAAERDFRRALDLFPPRHPDRARLLVGAGEAAHQAGELEKAARHYDLAIAEFREQGDLLGAGETMVRLSRLMWWRGDTVSGRTLLTDAVELLGRLPTSREFALACARMAGDHVLAGRAASALEWAGRAIELSDRLGLDDVGVRARQYRGLARCESGNVSDGLADLRAALEDGLRLGLSHETATAYDNLGDWVWLTEGPRAGLEVNRTGVEFAERRGQPETWTWTKAETLWMLYDAGEWDEALRVADEVLEWDRAHGGNQVGVIAATHRALVLVRRGDAEEAAGMWDDFLPVARRIGDPEVLVPALTTAATIADARGDLPAALELIRELDEATRDKPPWRARDLPDAVEICIRARTPDLAARLLEGAAEAARRQGLCVLTARAGLEENIGAHEAAADMYAPTVAGWREFGSPLNTARSLLGLARSAHALRRDWRGWAGEAKEIFEGLGAGPLASEAERLFNQS